MWFVAMIRWVLIPPQTSAPFTGSLRRAWSARKVEDDDAGDDKKHGHRHDHPKIHLGCPPAHVDLRHAVAVFVDCHGEVDRFEPHAFRTVASCGERSAPSPRDRLPFEKWHAVADDPEIFPVASRRVNWCPERVSNPHAFRGRRILSPLRLPIPPSGRREGPKVGSQSGL